MKNAGTERIYIGASHRALYVALAFVLLSMIPGLFIPGLKPFAYIAPLVYILLERRRKGRSWEEIGVKLRGFRKDLLHNWYLVLIVAVVLQVPVPLIARAYWPDLIQHISDRVPFLNISSIGLDNTGDTIFRRTDIPWSAPTTVGLVPKWVRSGHYSFNRIWLAALHYRFTRYSCHRPSWSIC